MKCYNCWVKPPDHKFSECLSVTCQCSCVRQLNRMYTNARVEDIKPVHPKFLKIENGKIKDLIGVDKEIADFNRVDRSEWLPKKKDKRFRKK